VNAKEEMRQKL